MAEMSFAFACSEESANDWASHETSTAMVQCPRCKKFAVAGYWCDTCGHTDVDEPDELTGHGPGKCEPAENP